MMEGSEHAGSRHSAGDPLPPKCAVIEVHVAELKQLFNSIDPSPFRNRDLDPKAKEFIVGWAKDLPREAPLALLVDLDRPAGLPDEAVVLRDAIHEFLMIGAHPPAAISDWRYIAVSMLAGLITFYWFPIINRLSSPVLVFDAAGLALFAVAGAGKALVFQAGPVAATLLGMLTGIGGGMVRDILVMEIPNVLQTELYAVAALIGAALMVLGKMLNLPTAAAATIGAVLCFGLRFIAMRRGWQLPIARPPHKSGRE